MSESISFDPNVKNVYRGWEIVVSSATLYPLLVITLGLRIYVRSVPSIRLGLDDAFAILAWVLATVTLVTDLLGVKHGLGRHAQFLTPDQIILAKKWISLSEVITNVVTWFVKLSICFFVVRLVKGTQRVLVVGIWCLVALVTVSSLVSVIVFLVQARPIDGIWNPNVKAKRISPFVAIDVAYVSNGINLFTDIACAILPIYFLWNVQISKWRKISLLTLTGLGVLTSVAGTLRIVFLNQVAAKDQTWAPTQLFVASICEKLGGAVLANMPSLKPIFARVVDMSVRRTDHNGYPSSREDFRRLRESTARVSPSYNKSIVTDEDILLKALSNPAGAETLPDLREEESSKGQDNKRGLPQGWIDPSL